MNNKTKPSFLMFASCLLLFAAIFLSRIIYEKASELNGRVSMNKVTVSIKGSTYGVDNTFLSMDDMERLHKLLGTQPVCFSDQVYSRAENDENIANARITGTDELALMFNDIKIKEGSFFSSADDRERSRVIVIEDRMAWELFNNDDVLGCYIKLFGSRFKIIGTVESDGSIIGKFLDDGTMQAYIPVQTYMDFNPGSGISYVQYATASGSTSGDSAEEISNALASLGKEPGSYIVHDYSLQGVVMRQKPKIILFMMGLFIIAAMFVFSSRELWRTIKSIRHELKEDYLSGVVRTFKYELIKDMAFLILAAVLSVLIWNLIRFDIYVPPDLIADDLSDLSYYMRLFRQKISLRLINTGYSLPFPETAADAVETIFNLIFAIGCIAGALLLFISLIWIKNEAVPVEKIILESGIFLVADILIVSSMSYAAGLPVILDVKAIMVFWTFIFTGLLVSKYGDLTHSRMLEPERYPGEGVDR